MFSHCLDSPKFIGVALSLSSVLSVVLVYLSLTVSASYVVSAFSLPCLYLSLSISTLSLSISISISISVLDESINKRR